MRVGIWFNDIRCKGKDPMAIFNAMQEAERAYKSIVKVIDVELKNYPALKQFDASNKEKDDIKEALKKAYEKNKPKTTKKRSTKWKKKA